MKAVAVLMFCGVLAAGLTPGHCFLDLHNVIEGIRGIMLNGDTRMGIPVVDPFTPEEFDFTLPGSLISFDVWLNNGHLTGLSDFIAHRAVLDVNNVHYDIEIPHLVLTADRYVLDGLFYSALPIFGDGFAHIEIYNLRITGTLVLGQSGLWFTADNLDDATFSVGHVRSYITGAIGGGDIDNVVNAVVEDLAASYITRFNEAIAQHITPIVSEYLTEKLRHYTIFQLMSIITRPRA